MFFKKIETIKLTKTAKSISQFSLIDKILQISCFNDGHFESAFFYFRSVYFELLDKHSKGLKNNQKTLLAEELKTQDRRDLAALSRIIQPEIFETYISKMYSVEERDLIRREVLDYTKRITVDPIVSSGSIL